jgi:hypothetical protein
MPIALPIPSKAIPTVATVLHELPVESETTEQMKQVANKKIVGLRIFSP